MVVVLSVRTATRMEACSDEVSVGSNFLMPSTTEMMFRPRLPLNVQNNRRCSVHPGRLADVLNVVYRRRPRPSS